MSRFSPILAALPKFELSGTIRTNIYCQNLDQREIFLRFQRCMNQNYGKNNIREDAEDRGTGTGTVFDLEHKQLFLETTTASTRQRDNRAEPLIRTLWLSKRVLVHRLLTPNYASVAR
jgi:hypothetical protein